MSRVFVFTNWDSFSRLGLKNNPWNAEVFPNMNHPYCQIFFSEEKTAELVSVSLSDLEKDGAYLVYDSIDGAAIKTLAGACRAGEVFILTHTTNKKSIVPAFCRQALTNPSVYVREGVHEQYDKYYYHVFDALTGLSDGRFDKVLSLLRPFAAVELQNVALRFFNGCMQPQNRDRGFFTAYEGLLEDEEIKQKIQSFYKDYYKGKTRVEDYQEELGKVSEEVMSIIQDRIDAEKDAGKAG